MKSFHKNTLVVASLVTIMAGEAWAATSYGEGEELIHDIETVNPHGPVGDGVHEAGSGLPQLDPTYYASQVFWLVLTFVGLYILFSRSILPAISNTLENRHEHIQGDLDTAERLKEEAESVQKSYESKLDAARTKANKLYLDVENDIQQRSEKEQAELRARLQKETELSEARIAKAKKEAMKEMDTIAAEIASIAAEKIVGISTDIKSAKDVVNDLNNKTKAA